MKRGYSKFQMAVHFNEPVYKNAKKTTESLFEQNNFLTQELSFKSFLSLFVV
jgi:hypothetical protein